MNKKIRFLGSVCLVWLFCCATVFANGKAEVLGAFTAEDSISVYVDDIEGEVTDISVQIGTNVADSVSFQPIKDAEIPMQTLLMLDNSLSIKNADRDKIADLMQDIVSDRLPGEQIAVATFSESMSYVTEYTDDYSTLKNAVEGIQYQDQETYLTDVLYEVLTTEFIQNPSDVYRRIIVISDGVDNKSLGYTKEELYNLLKEYSVPVYTVGCSTGKNDEQLENMFALSRMTMAESFLISEIDNTFDINNVLNEDRSVIKLTVKPAPVDMDGTKKAVKIVLNEGVNLSAEIKMPQKQMEYVEEVPDSEEETIVEVETEEEEEEEGKEIDSSMVRILIIVALGAVALIVIVVICILVISMKKKNKVEFEGIDDNILKELEIGIAEPAGKTEMITSRNVPSDDDKTCMIWQETESYHVILTDVDSPMKSFQIPLKQSIIIGRKQGVCGIVIDYDKSVSGRHCQISVRNGKFYIADLQSSNGTYVNENKVLSEVEIYSGTVIKLGRLKLRFEVR